MTDEKNDALLRRLIPGPDGQSPVWLYPDGSHRAITRLDVSDINATLASTRAQPVADDAGGDDKAWIKATPHETYAGLLCQFRGLKSMVNSMGQQLSFYQKKSYETGEKHLAALQESLESERAMNAALTEELALRQPPAADNREDTTYLISVLTDIREKTGVGSKPMLSELADEIVEKYAGDKRGVDVEAFNLIDELSGAFDDQTYSQKKSHDFDAPDDAEFTINVTAKQLRDIDNIASRGLLRTTPEDAKVPEPEKTKPRTRQIIVGYYELPYSKRREIAEKLGLLEKIRSVPAHEEVRVIFTAAKESDRLEQLFDFIEAATPQPEHEVKG